MAATIWNSHTEPLGLRELVFARVVAGLAVPVPGLRETYLAESSGGKEPDTKAGK